MPPIKVRFAPSPTGHLHIGGVRTALFNYLLARNKRGKFFLRMEDTDRERSKEEFAREILESLKWLGLEWDGEIVYQSHHLKRYEEIAGRLVRENKAYRVDATTPALKFRMPKETLTFADAVKGRIQFDTTLFDDLVIVKSDGFPTYNFACVVDDHDMEITHVIRGEDHISNTPRQIEMFRALGWPEPQFAHLPLIVGRDGAPLSKRHGAVSLKAYEEEGFLPEGILNYLALLGWSPGGNRELFTKEEMIKDFSLKRVNTTPAVFDPEKLRHVNTYHLRRIPEEDYLARGRAFLGKDKTWDRVLLLFRDRIKNWRDLLREADYCFQEEISYDPEAVKKYFQDPETRNRLTVVLEELKRTNDFSSKALEALIREKAKELSVEAAKLIHPIRVAITGVAVSPSLFDLMEVLGREKVLNRLEKGSSLPAAGT